jgi:hypothetical protein
LNFRERPASEIPAIDLLRIDVCASLVQGLAMVDPIRAHPFHARLLLLAVRSGELFRISRALCSEVGYFALKGGRESEKVEQLLSSAQEFAERSGSPNARGLVALANGMAAFLRGEWRNAAERMTVAELILRERCTWVAWEVATANMMGTLSLFPMGEWKQLKHQLPRIIKDAQARWRPVRSDRSAHTFSAHDLSCSEQRRTGASRDLLRNGRMAARGIRSPTLVGMAWSHRDGTVRRRAANRVEARRSRLAQASLVVSDACVVRLSRVLTSSRGSPSRWRRTERARWSAANCCSAPSAMRAAWNARADHGRALWQLCFEPASVLHEAHENRVRSFWTPQNGSSRHAICLYSLLQRGARGQLLGGARGSELSAEAENWMQNQEILNPARITTMLAPGFGISK